MTKRKRFNRIAATVLTALLLVAALPFYAFAVQGLDASIPVTKLVQGDAPAVNETFLFHISAVTENAPLPASGNELQLTGNGTANFDIHYDHAGVYEYEITEAAGNADRYGYDDTVYRITAVVTNTDTGGLDAQWLIQKPGGTEKYAKILFTNTYTAPIVSPPPGAPPTASLTVSNTVTGSLGNIDDVFHFKIQLYDKDGKELTDSFLFSGVYMPGGTIQSGDTFTLKHGQSICIKDLPVGTVYVITEVEQDQNGYSTSAMYPAGIITAVGNASHWVNYRPGLSDPKPSTVFLDPQKTLDGVAPKGSEYTFYLKDESGHVLETVHNDGGAIAVSSITLTQVGTYIYYMSEAATGPSGIVYDGSVYQVTITVTQVGTELVSQTDILRNGKPFDGTVPVFENTTKVEPETDKTITINKTWTGDDNAKASRPNQIEVIVSQSGQADQKIALTADSNWQAKVKISTDGSVTIKEVTPDGYASSVSGDVDAGFVITNTYTGGKPSTTPSTPSSEPGNNTELPKTGDETNMPGMIAGLLLCILTIAAALLGIYQVKKRYRG